MFPGSKMNDETDDQSEENLNENSHKKFADFKKFKKSKKIDCNENPKTPITQPRNAKNISLCISIDNNKSDKKSRKKCKKPRVESDRISVIQFKNYH